MAMDEKYKGIEISIYFSFLKEAWFMTSQTSYWNRLIQPGIVALVGAGGKTTVLSKLVEYGRLKVSPS